MSNNKNENTKWHDGYTLAIELTFSSYRQYMRFGHEVIFRNKHLRVDQTIEILDDNLTIRHPMAEIMRKHNIAEYKSEAQSCNMKEFLKTLLYAIIYRYHFGHLNDDVTPDTTLTIFRYNKPVKLLKNLNACGFKVKLLSQGIYVLDGFDFFKGQIVVGKELPDNDDYKWLKPLRKHLSKEEALKLLHDAQSLDSNSEDWLKAHTLVDIIASGNIKAFKKAKEVYRHMIGYGGIEKVFEEEIKEATDQVKKETTAKVEKETTARVEKETAARVEKETTERIENKAKKSMIDTAKNLLISGVAQDIIYKSIDHHIVDQAKLELNM